MKIKLVRGGNSRIHGFYKYQANNNKTDLFFYSHTLSNINCLTRALNQYCSGPESMIIF